jgi:putative endonuclease
VAEGGGLLNRYRVVKPYRGFESLRLRHPSPCGLRVAGHLSFQNSFRVVLHWGEGCLPKLPRSVGRLGPRSLLFSSREAWGIVLVVRLFSRLSNGDIYIGSTSDLRRRFASHNNGRVVSTRQYLPAILRSYVAVADEATARSLERYFKSGSGKAFAKKRLLATSASADGE